jgi:carboxyl-terminal processing protease
MPGSLLNFVIYQSLSSGQVLPGCLASLGAFFNLPNFRGFEVPIIQRSFCFAKQVEDQVRYLLDLLLIVIPMKYFKLTSFALLLLGLTAFIEGDNKQFEISKNLEIFANVYRELNTHYVDDIDPSRLMRIGIEAMLETLDPYTNYISESDIESYRYMAEGKYDGIGANVRKMGDYVTIVDPYEGGPAIEAGLQAGDMIITVEGKDVKGKMTDEVNDILRGFPGTEVTITIRRPGEDQDREITVKRDEVDVKNVPYSGMITDNVGYVVLTTFTNNAGKNIANAIQTLQKEHPDLKGLIFDLRNNGGGYLREAISISNLFIPKDEVVVTTKGKVRDRDRSFNTTDHPLVPDIPLVILTDKYTASASEIVSGVVQDLDRGVILGDKTYGKGLVQNTVDLDYNARLKLTTAKYYIPSGRCIQSVSYQDGEPVDVPEEQRAVFKTRAGRKVLDGGGIIPDVLTGDKNQSATIRFLLDNDLIFHYATVYRQKNPDIGPARDFRFTDFEEFVDFMHEKQIDFKTKTEKELDDLIAAADEDHFTELLKTNLGEIRTKIAQDKADDLTENKDEIIALLEREIVGRYHYQTGRIEKTLQNDKDIKMATDILNQPEVYNRYLRKN